MESGQIIATSHDLTPNGGLVREIPLFQGNLGWWKILIWPDGISGFKDSLFPFVWLGPPTLLVVLNSCWSEMSCVLLEFYEMFSKELPRSNYSTGVFSLVLVHFSDFSSLFLTKASKPVMITVKKESVLNVFSGTWRNISPPCLVLVSLSTTWTWHGKGWCWSGVSDWKSVQNYCIKGQKLTRFT